MANDLCILHPLQHDRAWGNLHSLAFHLCTIHDTYLLILELVSDILVVPVVCLIFTLRAQISCVATSLITTSSRNFHNFMKAIVCFDNQGCKTLAKNDDQVAVVESSTLPFIQQAGASKFQIVWKSKI